MHISCLLCVSAIANAKLQSNIHALHMCVDLESAVAVAHEQSNAWLYLNVILSNSQLFIPVLDLVRALPPPALILTKSYEL